MCEPEHHEWLEESHHQEKVVAEFAGSLDDMRLDGQSQTTNLQQRATSVKYCCRLYSSYHEVGDGQCRVAKDRVVDQQTSN